ncbi:LysR family transcriptional regulator [Acinetobacter nosocomialis]|uniref:LysR family transcriptional regulator n=1 Tax=Acinetobacter nosocomialis TaxID=106654 RepID=UPI002F40B6E2
MKSLDLTRFDLNLLVVLEALWNERHVGRAAESLHITQSATSHALSRLRNTLEDPLFIRNPKGIEPTPLTVELMPQVKTALELIRQVATPRGQFDPMNLKRPLVLAVTDHAILTVINPAFAQLQKAAPDIVLKLKQANTESALSMLDNGDIDIVIGSGSFFQIPQRLDCQFVHQERFVGIARKNHPALIKRDNKKYIDINNFVKFPHILVSPNGDIRGIVDEVLKTHNLTRKISVICPSFLAVPFLVGNSDSIAVIAERVALKLQETAQLSIFELPLVLPTWEVYIIRSRDRINEPMIEWITNTLISAQSAI